MSDLKPCPFCGSVPKLLRMNGIVGLLCGNECDNKGLSIAFHPDKESQAIAAWNHRAGPAPASEVERLREALRELLAHEGEQEACGIGMVDSEALENARAKAYALLQENNDE